MHVGVPSFLTEKKQVETGTVKGNKPSTQQEEKEIEKMGRGGKEIFIVCTQQQHGGVFINKDLNRTICRAANLEYDSKFLLFKCLNVPIGVFICKWVV